MDNIKSILALTNHVSGGNSENLLKSILSKRKIVVINGEQGSGKDLFINSVIKPLMVNQQIKYVNDRNEMSKNICDQEKMIIITTNSNVFPETFDKKELTIFKSSGRINSLECNFFGFGNYKSLIDAISLELDNFTSYLNLREFSNEG